MSSLLAILLTGAVIFLPAIAWIYSYRLINLYRNRGKKKEVYTIHEAIESAVSREEISVEVGAVLSALEEKYKDSMSARFTVISQHGLDKEHHIVESHRLQLRKEASEYNANLELNRLKDKYRRKYEKMTPTYLIEKHLLGKDDPKRGDDK